MFRTRRAAFTAMMSLVLASPLAFGRGSSSSAYEAHDSAKGHHVFTPGIGMFGSGPVAMTGKPNGGTFDNTVYNGLSGIFGIGGDYEYMVKSDIGVGGLFRYYSTEDSGGDSTQSLTFKTSTVLLGPIVRAYLINTDSWMAAITTGITSINASYKVVAGSTTNDYNPTMHFGWIMGWNLFYKFDSKLAFGIENLRVLAVGDKINGWAVDDFMFKVRIAL